MKISVLSIKVWEGIKAVIFIIYVIFMAREDIGRNMNKTYANARLERYSVNNTESNVVINYNSSAI